jgi:hypothetical protein
LFTVSKIATALLSIIGIVVFANSNKAWLFRTYPVPVWQLLCIAIVPILLYIVSRNVYLGRKRKYKLGDAVMVYADNRKFIVLRHEFYYPKHAVCKAENSNFAISINEKYLTPYKEPVTLADILKPTATGQLPRGIPHATLTKL